MSRMLVWVVAVSTFTAVTDWAGWHFVWRHEKNTNSDEVRKRTILSFVISYFFPFLPTIIVIGGPEVLEWYDQGFTKVASIVLIIMLGLISAGLTASGYSWKKRHDESQENRHLVGTGELLSEEAMSHLTWTTTMMALTSIMWWALLFV